MSKRRLTVRQLAAEANVDLDEALVILWDAGVDSVLVPDDAIAVREVAIARRAFEVPTLREESNISYWVERSGLALDAFVARVAEAGIDVSPAAKKIPRGSLRKLRMMFGGTTPNPSPTIAPPPMPPLRWEVVGNPTRCGTLSEDQVIAIHDALVEDFKNSSDPIFPEGIRSAHLLSSALTRPQTGMGDLRKYPSVEMAGAALLHSLTHNHAFHNGNKRTALVSLLVFLDEHGLVLTCNQDDLFKFVLKVGQHSLVPISADQLPDREVLEIARWIRGCSRPVAQGERPLQWLKLKQRLREFNCTWSPGSGGGSKINLSRVVQKRGLLRSRSVTLKCQAGWAGDGTEADRRTIHMIRNRLELDDDHNIDSTSFYGGVQIDDFILEYRRILRRLGKF